MSSTSRCLTFATVLALAALLLSFGASPASLGTHAAPAMLVVLLHAWVITVGERTCPDRGGKDIKRFPLGPRLMEGGSALTCQLAVPVVLLAMGARSAAVAAGGLALIFILSTSSLRRLLPFILPICGAIWAVSTMDEFHTLGDLLDSARGWVTGLVGLVLGTFVLGGPLLRADMAGVDAPRGKLVVVMAGLPACMAGVLIASRPDLVGAPPDLLALAGGVLVGGLLQALITSLLGRAGDISERPPEDFTGAWPRPAGLSIMFCSLPVLVPLSFGWVALPSSWAALAPPAVWAGVTALLLIVPLVPAAGLVAEGLDRADGRAGLKRTRLACWGALGLWFVAGPMVLGWMYGDGGLVTGLLRLFPGVPTPWPMQVGSDGGSALTGTALGGGLSFHGLPVADLCRGVTLMVAASAALSSRSMRHAADGGRGVRWGTLVLSSVLASVGIMALLPRLGPLGAPLAVAGACVIMLVLDGCREPVRRKLPAMDSSAGA